MSTTAVEDSIQWTAILAAMSTTVKRLCALGNASSIRYWDSGTNSAQHPEAFHFANDTEHNCGLARCFDTLSGQAFADKILFEYLVKLTNGVNTYGAATELLTYLWMVDHHVPFQIQVPMTSADVLNPNGSELDGKLTASSDVLFDIKAFGFQKRLAGRLVEKLEADMPGKWVSIGGNWDVPVEVFQDLLSYKSYQQLLSDLRTQNLTSRGPLEFLAKDKQKIQISHRSFDPYQFAQENCNYVFKDAKQFCRNQPFILFLAHHPWLGGQSFNENFANSTSTTFRSLARRSFIQFLTDTTPIMGTTKAEASRMLSAIAFLNVSLLPGTDRILRLFLNPNAKTPMPNLGVDILGHRAPSLVQVDRFSFDNY